jgi:hypothetical protein
LIKLIIALGHRGLLQLNEVYSRVGAKTADPKNQGLTTNVVITNPHHNIFSFFEQWGK